jgi:hypothetical protein
MIMKKLLLLAAIIFSIGMYAQEGKMPKKDHLMMDEGKMWIVKDGKITAMTQDMRLSDGSKVSPAGKVDRADGNVWLLNNGEAVDMNGMIIPSETKKEKSKMK